MLPKHPRYQTAPRPARLNISLRGLGAVAPIGPLRRSRDCPGEPRDGHGSSKAAGSRKAMLGLGQGWAGPCPEGDPWFAGDRSPRGSWDQNPGSSGLFLCHSTHLVQFAMLLIRDSCFLTCGLSRLESNPLALQGADSPVRMYWLLRMRCLLSLGGQGFFAIQTFHS